MHFMCSRNLVSKVLLWKSCSENSRRKACSRKFPEQIIQELLLQSYFKEVWSEIMGVQEGETNLYNQGSNTFKVYNM